MGESTSFKHILHLFSHLLTEGIVLLNNRQQLIYCNDAAKKILGITRTDRAVRKRAFLSRNKILMQIIREARTTGAEAANREVTHRSRGIERRLLVTVAPIDVREDSESPYLILVCNNITTLWKLHRKERELMEHLQQNHIDHMESLRQIADSIAHEVRNPIVSIGGYARLLLKRVEGLGPSAPDFKKYLTYICEDAERLSDIVTTTEKYSDTSEVLLQKRNIIPLFNEALGNARRLARKGGIAVKIMRGEIETYTMYIDRKKLRDSLKRLISYSVHLSTAGSTMAITLSITPYDAEMILAVRTERITPEDVRFIFNPFFTTTEQILNFDLPIVHRTVLLHGGAIHAGMEENTLTFTLSLPKEKRLRPR